MILSASKEKLRVAYSNAGASRDTDDADTDDADR